MKKIIIGSIALIFSFVISGTASASHNADGLIGYWDFDENTGLTAVDSSGHGNDGSLTNGPSWDTINIPVLLGNVSSLAFDGTNDFMNVSHDVELNVDAVTVSSWIRVDSSIGAGTRNIVRKGHFGNRVFGLDIDGTTKKIRGFVVLGSTGGSAIITTGTTALSPGAWYHVAMTYDGLNVRVYVDDDPDGISSLAVGTISDNTLSVRIGGQPSSDSGGALAFKGNIDEVRIYDKALTADEISILADKDGDGVGAGDLCSDTDADEVTDEGLGTNRWMWDGTNWVTKKPKATSISTGWVNMAYTYGCSGEQILEALEDATEKDFEGHWKFGVSKSILEEWNAGRYYLETITVPASDEDGVSSLMSLLSGQEYDFKATGTAMACNELGCVIPFDAEYSTSDGTTWVDGVAAPYTSYGPNLLDLMVNGGFVDWDDDAVYNPDHVYWYEVIGTGVPITFGVYDVYYPNNTGNLTVDIYADLW